MTIIMSSRTLIIIMSCHVIGLCALLFLLLLLLVLLPTTGLADCCLLSCCCLPSCCCPVFFADPLAAATATLAANCCQLLGVGAMSKCRMFGCLSIATRSCDCLIGQ